MKEKPKKRPVEGKKKHNKGGKKLVTGHTEVMDFDFDEEILIIDNAVVSEGISEEALAEATYENGEDGQELSETAADMPKPEEIDDASEAEISKPEEPEDIAEQNAAPDTAEMEAESENLQQEESVEESTEQSGEELNESWDTMPEKEVTIGDDTMELLGLEGVLLEEVYPEPEAGISDSRKTVPAKKTSAGKTKRSAGKKQKHKKGGFFKEFDMMDRIIAATGVLIVLVALMTAGLYSRLQTAREQVAAMAEIGMKMETIGVAGEGIFTAVADAQTAARQAADYAEDEESGVAEYEEKELTTEINVGLKLTSVQRDLKIKFTNKSSGKLIGNQPFEVSIKGPENMTKTDDDEDGIIYISSLKAGEYTVTITAPEELEGSKVNGVSAIVTVKDQIEYKKIDVADEVKTESEINAAKEDTAVAVEIESVSTDTVEWVESSKTAISGSVSYVEVKKADIPDPANSASAGFVKIAALTETEAETQTENGGEAEETTESASETEENGSGFETESIAESVPESIKVTGVIVDYSDITLTVGNERMLAVTVEPSDASDTSVEWSSSDSSVASVDGSGKVTAVGPGTAQITVTAKDGSGVSDVCAVTVKEAEKEEQEEESEEETKAETEEEKETEEKESEEKEALSVTLEEPGSIKAGEEKQLKWTVTGDADASRTVVTSSDTKLATVDNTGKVKALEKGSVTITVTVTGKSGKTAQAVGTLTIKAADTTAATFDKTAKLKDSAGNQLYVKEGENYREATAADYYNFDVFYRRQDESQYLYTGWQNIDGKRYYFDKNGVPVTGSQIIQGMQYSFNSDGSLVVNGSFGIDVSKHNGNIDWNAVKNAGVDFVIIRCGYRGSATGVLVEDPKFKANIQGAAAAGLKVGIYFFSQAVNEVEAVEEASMTLSLISKYKISYPVYIDVEAANGRADGMDAATRTKVIKAYCQTIKNSGYTAGIYANKTWLNSMFNVSELGSYKIWLAQYAATPTYGGRYEMWQYSSTGKISGISGNVDLNTSYMTY